MSVLQINSESEIGNSLLRDYQEDTCSEIHDYERFTEQQVQHSDIKISDCSFVGEPRKTVAGETMKTNAGCEIHILQFSSSAPLFSRSSLSVVFRNLLKSLGNNRD